MLMPSDYKDLLKLLNKHRVRYLIVGAYAVIYYTEPRYTKDLDIWVKPVLGNAKKVYAALKEFGAPLKPVKINDFINKNLVYQIGVDPVRADIIMGMGGMSFDKAYRNRKVIAFDGMRVSIIGINELIKSKKKTKRQSDIIDVESLHYKLRLQKKKRSKWI